MLQEKVLRAEIKTPAGSHPEVANIKEMKVESQEWELTEYKFGV